jgi:hypothetical protein
VMFRSRRVQGPRCRPEQRLGHSSPRV